MAEINVLLKLRNELGTTINPGREETLVEIRDRLESLKTYTDQLEGYVDGLEALAAAIGGNTDGLEGLLATLGSKDFATQATLAELKTRADLLAAEATLQLRNNAFATLLHYQPDTTGKELRADETSTDRYHGRAVEGTATSAASWEVVRFYKDASDNVIRTRYRTGVVWDNRAAGW